MRKINLIILALFLHGANPAYGQASSTVQYMSFEKCLQLIRRVSSQLGVAPINIVETRDLRMVRYPTSDGSVLVTCSRADGKMVMTKSDKRR